ncbi:MAG TPA: zinc ribbon domain-containing protein [Candidatus Dormibacteraeota bacterium]|nr:zinc ribbon domain-containing protein [Candidatus Dormibacteraeota bacterium]
MVTATGSATASRVGENYDVEDQRVRLRASRCRACGAVFHPPRLVCAGCGHRELEPVHLGPVGTAYTFTCVHQSTPDFQTPYVLVYVDFPEAVRVLLPFLGDEPPAIGETVELVLGPGPRLADGVPVTLVHAGPLPSRRNDHG